MPTTIHSGLTIPDPINAGGDDNSNFIFTMSDGNVVIVYWDGTNGGYRIKSAGTWGSFVNFATIPLNNFGPQRWTRNGDTLYGLTKATGNFVQVRKLAYSAGSITQTTVSVQNSGGGSIRALAIYWDTTNSFLHIRYATTTSIMYIEAYDANLVFKYALSGSSAGPQDIGPQCFVGDGSSTFLLYCGISAVVVFRYVAGASSYTTAGTQETGLPIEGAGQVAAVYDGTNIVLLFTGNGKTKYFTRTAIDTYSALTELGAGFNGTYAVSAFVAKGDIYFFMTNLVTQANGEIYYFRRYNGAWYGPLLLAGGDATGWSYCSVSPNDLNIPGVLRAAYVTGTTTWALVEDILIVRGSPPQFSASD
jgi:hypothetical protein